MSDFTFCVLQTGHYCSECLECVFQNRELEDEMND